MREIRNPTTALRHVSTGGSSRLGRPSWELAIHWSCFIDGTSGRVLRLDTIPFTTDNGFALRRLFQTSFAVLIAIFCLAGFASSQTRDNKLREELLAMRERDQKAREGCPKEDVDAQMKCYAAIAESVDKPNTRRLEEIVRKVGVPDVKMVGADGMDAFYLVLQHSQSVALKKKSLKGIKRAFKAKELRPMDYANFTDRLLVNLGKPQVYGSNFDFKDGKLVMSRTKDVGNLDVRRKKLGLPPIAEYARVLKEMYKMQVVFSQ